MQRLLRAALAAASVLLVSACQPAPSTDVATPTATDSAAEAEASEVAALINGEAITTAELDAWIKDDLFAEKTRNGNAAKLYEVREEALATLLRERVLESEASKRNLDVDGLIEAETAALGPVTEVEMSVWYEDNKPRLGERSYEDLKERIRDYLEGEREGQAIQAIQDRADVVVKLEAPRFEVAADGPSLGSPDAPITIVEFSDFECPFCERASTTVKALLERYPNQVRLVYRQFPLERIHPRARAAAEASLCAADQDQFWPYHDKLFANAKKLKDEDLKRYAEELGLDGEAFGQCLDSGTHRGVVTADLAAGSELGVTGTPAFFVNGIMLTGARPTEAFVEIIDRELARLEAGGGAESAAAESAGSS